MVQVDKLEDSVKSAKQISFFTFKIFCLLFVASDVDFLFFEFFIDKNVKKSVGKVEKILTGEIKKKIDNGFIPVIAPIGKSKNNDYWNINADVVAGEVAQSLKAEKLILLTDVKGIGDSENKLISKISLKKGQKVLKEKFIKGGMTPKLTAALEAKKNGVKSCHIIDGRVPHAVLLEVLTEEGVGTMIS